MTETATDTREVTCSTCPARVRWYVTISGKVIALDADPVDDGNVIVISHEGRVRARILEGADMPAQQTAYRRHRCPPHPVLNERRCVHCHLVMSGTDSGFDTHPTCDPEYLDDLRAQAKPAKKKKGKGR